MSEVIVNMRQRPAVRPPYSARAWFWRVGPEGNQQLYSSAVKGYISEDDAAFVAFVAAGGVPTSTASMEELTETLTIAGVQL